MPGWGWHGTLQFQKLRNCLHPVQASEQSRGKRFDWLVRIRPDTVWRAPVGALADFDAAAVHMVFLLNMAVII